MRKLRQQVLEILKKVYGVYGCRTRVSLSGTRGSNTGRRREQVAPEAGGLQQLGQMSTAARRTGGAWRSSVDFE